jgi:hypothetical protein
MTWLALCSSPTAPAACVTSQTSPEITCNLGFTVSWAAGDVVRVTVPVVASTTAGGVFTNVANVIDLKNKTASGKTTLEVCKDCGVNGVSNQQQTSWSA